MVVRNPNMFFLMKDRIIYIDILKGILIISVVLGHLGVPFSKYIYWFHMPVFFMVSGLFLFKETETSMKDFVKRKIDQYVVPYFSYSILLGVIVGYESIIKMFVRTFYGGAMNTTCYSYPYWFINVLFLSGVFLFYVNTKYSKKMMMLIVFICYISAHFDSIYLEPKYHYSLYVPWSANIILIAVFYIYVGISMKEYILYLDKLDNRYKIGLLSVLLFVLAIVIILFADYELNMKSVIYTDLLLDFVIPILFLFILSLISSLLKYTIFIRYVLSELGRISMVIFFFHAILIYELRKIGIENNYIILLLILVVSIFSEIIFSKSKYMKYLFLGKK